MTHYEQEREEYDRNINEIYTKQEQKQKLIGWLMDCFEIQESDAVSYVEKQFKDLK
jgi:hypothetical protein